MDLVRARPLSPPFPPASSRCSRRVRTVFFSRLYIYRNNDIAGILDDETFSYLEERFGEQITVEIVPGGARRSLTNANKHDWVRLVHNR